eukprot:c9650_g1_i1.p1 GENE.c9650_g1_i1~~c9650_g1_i1.p1  ORF type:complete len:936 (+),score=230.98 c9650_g1_i1:67-2874(+)
MHTHNGNMGTEKGSVRLDARAVLAVSNQGPLSPTPSPRQDASLVLDDLTEDIKRNIKPLLHELDQPKSVARKVINYLSEKHDLSPSVNLAKFIKNDPREVTKAQSKHAVAAQRAAAFFGLEINLLENSLQDLQKHIEDTISFHQKVASLYVESYYFPTFVDPLRAEAKRLETKMIDARKNEQEAQNRFEVLRQMATQPLMEQLQDVNKKYGHQYKAIEKSVLDELTQTVKTLQDQITTQNQNAKNGGTSSTAQGAKLRQTPSGIDWSTFNNINNSTGSNNNDSNQKQDPKPKSSVIHRIFATRKISKDQSPQANRSLATTSQSDDTAVPTRSTPAPDTYTMKFLQELYCDAQAAKPVLQKALGEIRKRCLLKHRVRVEVEMGELKSVERSMEKTVEEYDGDFSMLLDLARGSVVCSTVREAVLVVKVIGEMMNSDTAVVSNRNTLSRDSKAGGLTLEVLRIKNRLNEQFPAATESGGYRDILMNVRLGKAGGGHVCELQIHVKGFLELKHAGGHESYSVARSLHLLDPELGQVRVSDVAVDGEGGVDDELHYMVVRQALRKAFSRVIGGTCQGLYLNHLKLRVVECDALRTALMAPACSVRDLSLPDCGLDTRKSEVLCFGLEARSPTAAAATISSNHKPESTRYVAPQLDFNMFRKIDLSFNESVSGECVGALVSEEIEELSLEGCKMSVSDIALVCDSLQRNQPRRIKVLNLFGNELGEAGARSLVSALPNMRTIEILDLRSAGLGPKGAAVLAPHLSHLHNLTALRLFNNSIGTEGAKAMAPSLLSLTCLTDLGLSKNLIGTEGMLAIAAAIQNMPYVTDLAFHTNAIGPEGAKAVAKVLANRPNITALALSHNEIGSVGARDLKSALANMTGLTELSLQGNQIGSSTFEELLPLLCNMPHLTELNIKGNDVSEELQQAFKSQLSHCKYLSV